MGECGCSTMIEYFGRIKGPHELWYALGMYPGCRYCDVPPSCIVDQLDTEALEDLEALGEQLCVIDSTSYAIPLFLSQRVVIEAVLVALQRIGIDLGFEDEFDRAEAINEVVQQEPLSPLVRDALEDCKKYARRAPNG